MNGIATLHNSDVHNTSSTTPMGRKIGKQAGKHAHVYCVFECVHAFVYVQVYVCVSVFVYVAAYVPAARSARASMLCSGSAFTSAAWRSSLSMRAVRSAAAAVDERVFCDECSVIYCLPSRFSHDFWRPTRGCSVAGHTRLPCSRPVM